MKEVGKVESSSPRLPHSHEEEPTRGGLPSHDIRLQDSFGKIFEIEGLSLEDLQLNSFDVVVHIAYFGIKLLLLLILVLNYSKFAKRHIIRLLFFSFVFFCF